MESRGHIVPKQVLTWLAGVEDTRMFSGIACGRKAEPPPGGRTGKISYLDAAFTVKAWVSVLVPPGGMGRSAKRGCLQLQLEVVNADYIQGVFGSWIPEGKRRFDPVELALFCGLIKGFKITQTDFG